MPRQARTFHQQYLLHLQYNSAAAWIHSTTRCSHSSTANVPIHLDDLLLGLWVRPATQDTIVGLGGPNGKDGGRAPVCCVKSIGDTRLKSSCLNQN